MWTGAAIVLAGVAAGGEEALCEQWVPAPARLSSCARPATIIPACCWPATSRIGRPGASAGSLGTSPKPTGATRAARRSTDLERSQRGIRDQAQAVLVGDISQPPCQGITRQQAGRSPASSTFPARTSPRQSPGSVTFSPRCTAEPDCPACSQGDGEHADSGFRPGAGRAATAATSTEGRPATRRWSRPSASSAGQGIVDLFFYMGGGGSTGGNKGGSGGAGTLVTKSDLQASPSTAPTERDADRRRRRGWRGRVTSGCGSRTPGTGGGGGVAISVAGTDGQRFGQGVKGEPRRRRWRSGHRCRRGR